MSRKLAIALHALSVRGLTNQSYFCSAVSSARPVADCGWAAFGQRSLAASTCSCESAPRGAYLTERLTGSQRHLRTFPYCLHLIGNDAAHPANEPLDGEVVSPCTYFRVVPIPPAELEDRLRNSRRV